MAGFHCQHGVSCFLLLPWIILSIDVFHLHTTFTQFLIIYFISYINTIYIAIIIFFNLWNYQFNPLIASVGLV